MVAPKLSANMRGQVAVGENLARQANQLEGSTRESIERIKEWLNRYLPTTRGGFSPYQTNRVTRSGILLPESCIVNLVDTTIDAFTLTLPAPVRDYVVIVKDAGSNASVNNITIARPNLTSLIDLNAGDATITTDLGRMWLICDGRDYWSYGP